MPSTPIVASSREHSNTAVRKARRALDLVGRFSDLVVAHESDRAALALIDHHLAELTKKLPH